MCVCWLSLSVWVLVFFTLVCSFRGGLVNVSWQCFPLGEPGYTIIQCFSAHSKVQLCVWVLGLQTRESVFSHTAPALTGWPGCCLINHHISIHHCLVPGAPQTREDQEDTADTLKLSAKCLVARVLRACVCVCVCAPWPDGTSWINSVWVLPRGEHMWRKAGRGSVTWTEWLLSEMMSSSSCWTINRDWTEALITCDMLHVKYCSSCFISLKTGQMLLCCWCPAETIRCLIH